jgi:hypothetical protein
VLRGTPEQCQPTPADKAASDGGTLARSEESWEGLLASLLKSYSRRILHKGIRSVLAHLKAEAERRAATA